MRRLTDEEANYLGDCATCPASEEDTDDFEGASEMAISDRLRGRGLIRPVFIETDSEIIEADTITTLGRIALACYHATRSLSL